MAYQRSALVVSGSDQLRNSLQILLRSMSRFDEVYRAGDGPAARAMAIEPSVVLLDYEVARNGSAGTLAGLRTEWPRAAYLALADNEDQQKCAANSGADAVLMKGASAARLLETIERLLKL